MTTFYKVTMLLANTIIVSTTKYATVYDLCTAVEGELGLAVGTCTASSILMLEMLLGAIVELSRMPKPMSYTNLLSPSALLQSTSEYEPTTVRLFTSLAHLLE